MKALNKSTLSTSVIDNMRSYAVVKWGLRGEEFDAFAAANMWFLTVMPKTRSADEAFKFFGKEYHRFLKGLCGNKPARNEQIQPMGYAFLDYGGSRSGRLPKAKLLPHIHALMMIHPMTRARFDAMPKEGTVFDGAKLFDPNRKDMNYIASYAMKGTIGQYGFRSDEDGKEWKVYPNRTSKTDPQFKRTGKIVPYTEVEVQIDDEALAELQRTADGEGFRRSFEVRAAILRYKASRKPWQRS